MTGYIDRQNAKYGRPGVRLSAYLHIMHALRGMICAAAVIIITGKVNDPPYLRPMIEALPEGDGNVSAGAAHGASRTATPSGTEGGHRLKAQRESQGIQRRGGDAGVSAGSTRDLPPDAQPSG